MDLARQGHTFAPKAWRGQGDEQTLDRLRLPVEIGKSCIHDLPSGEAQSCKARIAEAFAGPKASRRATSNRLSGGGRHPLRARTAACLSVLPEPLLDALGQSHDVNICLGGKHVKSLGSNMQRRLTAPQVP